MTRTFHLRKIDETFAICKLTPGDPLPPWATSGKIWSITHTPSELSIVCPQGNLPQDIEAELNWRALQVVGQLSFEMVGVLSSLTASLAEAAISVFAISTFDVDFILVRGESFEAACQALIKAGNTVDSQ
jgi:uncharacterized protein